MSRDQERLVESRLRFERRWRELQGSLQREVGVAPRRRGWLLLLFAAAAGLTIGMTGSRLLRVRGEDPAAGPMPYEIDL